MIKDRYSSIRNLSFCGLIFISLLLLCGCHSKTEDDTQNTDESDSVVYYIDNNATNLLAKPLEISGTTRDEQIKEYIKALETKPEDLALEQAIPSDVDVEYNSLNESNRLTLNFTSNYGNITGVKEVLCRAAIVKTLCQVDDIEDVEFYIAGQPLKKTNDKVVGAMKDTDFIDDSSAENVLVNIYFANENGKKMVSSLLKITSYDGNISIEKLIINQLIKGPVESKMKKTIPAGTELLDVRTKDGICFVDFNEKFLDKVDGVKPEVVLYSVVNSLVQLTTINRVQFSINGQTKKIYREDIPFSETFERNLDLIEEGSK